MLNTERFICKNVYHIDSYITHLETIQVVNNEGMKLCTTYPLDKYSVNIKNYVYE